MIPFHLFCFVLFDFIVSAIGDNAVHDSKCRTIVLRGKINTAIKETTTTKKRSTILFADDSYCLALVGSIFLLRKTIFYGFCEFFFHVARLRDDGIDKFSISIEYYHGRKWQKTSAQILSALKTEQSRQKKFEKKMVLENVWQISALFCNNWPCYFAPNPDHFVSISIGWMHLWCASFSSILKIPTPLVCKSNKRTNCWSVLCVYTRCLINAFLLLSHSVDNFLS